MSNSAVGSAYTGPTRTSMDVGHDTVVVIEQGGTMQFFRPTLKQEGIQVHLISPIYSQGEVEHEGKKVNYTCQVMPDMRPGFPLKKFIKELPEPFKTNIQQMAKAMIPQHFHRIGLDKLPADTLSYEHYGLPYKLIYTYSID